MRYIVRESLHGPAYISFALCVLFVILWSSEGEHLDFKPHWLSRLFALSGEVGVAFGLLGLGPCVLCHLQACFVICTYIYVYMI